MGEKRKFGQHVRWSKYEEQIIQDHYPTATYCTLKEMLPGRTRKVIQGKAYQMGVKRHRSPKLTKEERNARSAERMKEKRAADLDASRQYQNGWRAQNKDRLNAELREQVAKRLFWGRALRLRGVCAFDLWKLWKSQKGRCALSGRKLDRTAEIDHKTPKVRGGTDDIANLQWTTVEANRAKRDLTDEEFADLCRDVCGQFVFDRIRAVDDLMKEQTA